MTTTIHEFKQIGLDDLIQKTGAAATEFDNLANAEKQASAQAQTQAGSRGSKGCYYRCK